MDDLIAAASQAVSELNERMDRDSNKRRENVTKILTYFVLPLTLMSGVLGLNISEYDTGSFTIPVRWVVLGCAVIGLSVAHMANRD